MTAALWASQWKPAFDRIVAEAPPPHLAVTVMLEHGGARDLAIPWVYASTAITSAGHRRDPALADPSKIGEAISRNNRTAALIMESLAANQAHLVDETMVMVPTELGKVPNWRDTDYLEFYFAWLAGLTSHGAERYSVQLREPEYTAILDSANDRSRPNAQRWPSYRIYTEIALAKLAQVESQRGSRQGDPAGLLLQLVDVEESLGCRAERLFAEARGLDIVAPTFDPQTDGDLGRDLATLTGFGAAVGVVRRPIELVAKLLR